MSNILAVDLLTLGAQTATGQGAAVDITALRTALDLTVRVDTVTGTAPTLAVVIETSGTGTGAWREVGRLSETIVDAGSYPLLVGECMQYVRVSYVIAGTAPSFTFSVAGNAHVLYCTRDDLSKFAMSSHVLDHIDESLKLENIIAATGEVSDFLSVAYTLPLASWGASLTKHSAIVAVHNMASGPGRQGLDETLRLAYEDTMRWLQSIGTGRLRPTTIIDATPTVEEDGAYVTSQTSRGW